MKDTAGVPPAAGSTRASGMHADTQRCGPPSWRPALFSGRRGRRPPPLLRQAADRAGGPRRRRRPCPLAGSPPAGGRSAAGMVGLAPQLAAVAPQVRGIAGSTRAASMRAPGSRAAAVHGGGAAPRRDKHSARQSNATRTPTRPTHRARRFRRHRAGDQGRSAGRTLDPGLAPSAVVAQQHRAKRRSREAACTCVCVRASTGGSPTRKGGHAREQRPRTRRIGQARTDPPGQLDTPTRTQRGEH